VGQVESTDRKATHKGRYGGFSWDALHMAQDIIMCEAALHTTI